MTDDQFNAELRGFWRRMRGMHRVATFNECPFFPFRKITQEQRRRFHHSMERLDQEARQEECQPTEGNLPHRVRCVIDRKAVRRALVEHSLLLFTRRRIPLPFPKKKMAIIGYGAQSGGEFVTVE